MLFAFASATLIAAAATQPWDDADHPAQASLIAEHTALTPGAVTRVGILFELERDWHLYWDGQNDSGFAPEINLSLPDGFSAGKVLWPAPKRKISPGDVLDHIYEHQVLLMIPIEVPAAAQGGEKIDISAEVDWLVCREACIPGSAQLALTLPVAASGAEPQPSRSAPYFARATERLPKPLPAKKAPVAVDRVGASYTFTSPKAVRTAFYPANECARLRNVLTDGEAEKNTLTLRLGRPDESDRLVGILEIWTGPRASTVWWIDTSPDPSASPLDAAKVISD